MDNYTPPKTKKKKYSAAIIAVIVCAAIVTAAVSIAILNPEGGFDLLQSFVGDQRSKIHLSEIKYVRPDTEGLINNFDTLIGMIQNGTSFTEQRSLYNKINTEYSNFSTMLNLAYLNYSADTSDEFYSEELAFLEKTSVTVENKLNLLLDTIAASNFKTNYERSYYGVGYFTDWKNLVYPDDVVALMEKESELIEQYRELMSDPFVTIGYKEIHLNDDLSSYAPSEYYKIVQEYYKKYNFSAGNIYVDLVKTRLQIAEKLGVSYAEHAYEYYDRDYTPQQAREYLDGISETVIPVIEKIDYDPSHMYESMDPSYSLYAVSQGANNMKGVVGDAFDYMFEYGLYDIGASENKSRNSFTTYLSNYNIPVLFVSPSGSATDFFTISHEFGHFVDAYSNNSMDNRIDSAEIASHAMEYLMPYYSSALRGYSHKELNEYSIYSATEIYMVQGYISSFESEVYSLSPDEVTVTKLNSIAYECATKFGLSQSAQLYQYAWIDITHIFDVPFYTISYVVSNDVALQILEAELNSPGKGGVEAFVKLIDREDESPFLERVADAGFQSPFSSERLDKIASMIEATLIKPDEAPETDPAATTPKDSSSLKILPPEVNETLQIPALLAA